jgi:hypothetical protein
MGFLVIEDRWRIDVEVKVPGVSFLKQFLSAVA